jgi:hypothetical protein
MIAYTVLSHGRTEDSPGFTVAAVEPGGHTTPIMIYETKAEAEAARHHIEQGARQPRSQSGLN